MLLYGYIVVVLFGVSGSDPISPGAISAPGPGIQSRIGGVLNVLDEPSLGEGDEGGPLYLARVEPGDEFQVLTSIRNTGPLPITLLGPKRFNVAPTSPGVTEILSALWIAPTAENSVFPAATELVPFAPMDLGPGEQVSIVLTFTGGVCADPDGQTKPPWNPNQLSYRTGPGFSFVYEVALWRKVGILWPQFDLDVATKRGCDV
jgi:hypothetical protein